VRPLRVILVAGTATEVGKTWVACSVARRMRAEGTAVAARKPVQSFDPLDARNTDSGLLAEATGEPKEVVCPARFTFPLAMAPPMAAEVLGRKTPTIGELCKWLSTSWQPHLQLGLVEAVGGVRSPLGEDGDTTDLARELDPDLILLVAEPGLGAINAVRSAVSGLGPRPVVVFLNRYDSSEEIHRRNRAWLEEHDHLEVRTEVVEAVSLLSPSSTASTRPKSGPFARVRPGV
jgi:dethiobiotin synthetase